MKQIKVSQLIEQLGRCPPDAYVDVDTPDGSWEIALDADLKVIPKRQDQSGWVTLRAETPS